MYTGIVQALLPIQDVTRKEGLMQFSVSMPDALTPGLETGASVAINGVCFTVTKMDGNLVHFDAIAETLALSNIQYLEPGTAVNVERSANHGTEVGGHILSGHIIGMAEVIAVEDSENNRRMTFRADTDWSKYVFNKGFLAVNGASLTIAATDPKAPSFSINLIPETLRRTNFADMVVGDQVNIEIESQTQVIVDTVERVMAERFASSA